MDLHSRKRIKIGIGKLLEAKEKITQKTVSIETGLSTTTVARHWKRFKKKVRQLNNELPALS